ncbi:unnamed protein product [Tenebrio molitor]|nr:unnamed protein product [Tenebrio molitor]
MNLKRIFSVFLLIVLLQTVNISGEQWSNTRKRTQPVQTAKIFETPCTRGYRRINGVCRRLFNF